MQNWRILIGAVAVLSLATTAYSKSFEKKAQVTLGGAEPVITGYITKVEEDAYLIQDKDGDETRIIVTDATNMICKSREEGRETAVDRRPGMGFRIGDCPFHQGEAVKVEVSDEGEATLIRYLEDQPLPKTAALGIPQDFGILAVPQGSLEFTETPSYQVRTLDGKTLGPLIGSIVDTELGMAYMVVLRDEDHHYLPIPWSKVKNTFPTKEDNPVMVVLETYDRIAESHPPLYTTKNCIDVESLREYWAQKPAPMPIVKDEIDLDIVVKNKKFHILSGGGKENNIELLAGTEPTIRIQNEDLVAHEFVSPLFQEVGFCFDGKATLVTTSKATGVRIDPGESVLLNMKIPSNFEHMYGLFWCNLHGKEHGDKMRGEVLVFESRTGDLPSA